MAEKMVGGLILGSTYSYRTSCKSMERGLRLSVDGAVAVVFALHQAQPRDGRWELLIGPTAGCLETGE